MRTLALLLPALLIASPGCVVTYGNFPDVSADALPKHHASKPVSYHVDRIPTALFGEVKIPEKYPTMLMVMFPHWYPLAMKDWGAGVEVIGKTLKTSGMVSELLALEEPPEAEDDTAPYKNLHVEVLFGVDRPSGPSLVLAMVDPIPYYSGEGGLRVRYSLYRRGIPYASYEYTIKKKGWGGILLLPLAWLNFFTDDLKDALRATTLQFLIDSYWDGNL